MAVLSKDEFFDRLRTVVGDDVSDDAIKLVEDFTDTYTDLEARASSDDSEALKEQLEKERASWAKLYKDRFFSSPVPASAPQPRKSSRSAPKPSRSTTCSRKRKER